MSKSTIQELAEYGQSIWLDYIDRPMLENGELKQRIENGLRGMTSNPSIFNKAIGSSNDYDQEIVKLKAQDKSAFEIYDALTIRDIQDAADCFKSVYEQTNRLDGYVSLEINPLLARVIEEQKKEGVRLFEKVNRPNVMIKVPSTEQGFAVIEELIATGINVNATLIFSSRQYEQTVQAYLKGLKRLSENGGDLSQVHSVASVFVSRVDTAVDKQLEHKAAAIDDEQEKSKILSLCGKAAVANCRLIFEQSKNIFSSKEYLDLEAKGANRQRVLWGSTSTKNPQYNDVKYISELIAKPTVNTVPEPTLVAFLDHGQVKEAFTDDAREAQQVVDDLNALGINLDDVNANLLNEGCVAFDSAFEELLDSVEKKAAQLAV